jgi:hypothetical protein
VLALLPPTLFDHAEGHLGPLSHPRVGKCKNDRPDPCDGAEGFDRTKPIYAELLDSHAVLPLLHEVEHATVCEVADKVDGEEVEPFCDVQRLAETGVELCR